MTTITKERLQEVIDGDIAFTDEQREMARIALAVKQAQPDDMYLQNFRTAMEGIGHIRRTLEETFGGLHGTHCEPDVLVECKAICDAICSAYRQTAPVVPVSEAQKLPFDEWLSQQDGEIEVDCGCVMTEVLFHWMRVAYEAGNYPATPDGWIPVSERMPDVGDIVLTAIDGCVNVGKMERSGANYRYFTSVISGRELPANHWQPLPAPPQQEVKSALEHGMQRYAGAMQNLEEGGD